METRPKSRKINEKREKETERTGVVCKGGVGPVAVLHLERLEQLLCPVAPPAGDAFRGVGSRFFGEVCFESVNLFEPALTVA